MGYPSMFFIVKVRDWTEGSRLGMILCYFFILVNVTDFLRKC